MKTRNNKPSAKHNATACMLGETSHGVTYSDGAHVTVYTDALGTVDAESACADRITGDAIEAPAGRIAHAEALVRTAVRRRLAVRASI